MISLGFLIAPRTGQSSRATAALSYANILIENMHEIPLRFFLSHFSNRKVPQPYEDSLKSSSVIIPTPVLERDVEKYNNNNNIMSNSSSSNNVALKIEEVSNETSNLMIEDRQQNTTTRWGRDSTFPPFHVKNIQISLLFLSSSSTNSERNGTSKPPYSYVALIGTLHSPSSD